MRVSLSKLIRKRKKLWDKHHDKHRDREYIDAVADKLTDGSASSKKIIDELKENPEFLIELFFNIINKERKLVPFFFNDVQKKLIAEINKAKDLYNKKKLNFKHFILLKGRQQGMTSVISAYQLACTILKSNFVGFTLAHDSESTSSIFENKAKDTYDRLPEKIKPVEKYNNRRELAFENLNSRWRVATAGSEDVGRGEMLNFVHLSEVAFYKDMNSILSGLGEALTQDSLIILETTANGFNEFKDLFDSAEKGKNNYISLFFRWWDSEEYRLTFENIHKEEEFKKKVNNKYNQKFEKLYNLKYNKNLDWEQIYWYYNKGKSLKHKLEQEYPCTPKEAFLTSGKPYFDSQRIDNLIIEYSDIKPVKVKQNGQIKIYERPKEGITYVAGADVAEGLKGGDYSSSAIYRRDTFELVCVIHGHYSPSKYGEILVRYAKKYNNAYLAVENNNHGHSTLNTIYNHLEYKNIHYTVNQKNKDNKPTKKKGWTTTKSSKYIMLDELEDAITSNDILIYDTKVLEQMREVKVDDKNKVDVNGMDMVVATAIAWQCRKFARKPLEVW